MYSKLSQSGARKLGSVQTNVCPSLLHSLAKHTAEAGEELQAERHRPWKQEVAGVCVVTKAAGDLENGPGRQRWANSICPPRLHTMREREPSLRNRGVLDLLVES